MSVAQAMIEMAHKKIRANTDMVLNKEKTTKNCGGKKVNI